MNVKRGNKLMAFFLAVAMVPLIIDGWIAYWRPADSKRKDIPERQQTPALERVNRVERLFEERRLREPALTRSTTQRSGSNV